MRVLAMSARPGSSEFACGGTLARISADGGKVAICTIANGNSAGVDIPPRELATIRRAEAEQAAGRLGAELFWLNNSDFAVSNDAVTRVTIADIMRAFSPDLVLTPAPLGLSQDVRNVWPLVESAAEMSAAPNARTDHEALPTPPPLIGYQPEWVRGFAPTAHVDVSHTVEAKRAALSAYLSLLTWLKESKGLDLLAAADIVMAYRGLQAGVKHAEAFQANPADSRSAIHQLHP